MLRRATTILVLAICVAVAGQSMAQSRSGNRSRYTVHIVTMGQGDDLFARFGHIAIMVDDRKGKTRKVYNFGTFDFDDPDLRLKYARGFLNYWLSVGDWQTTVMHYQYFNRQLEQRTLDLTPAQSAGIAKKLMENARPENRYYEYRHYVDNCCTRIRDILDEELEGAISAGRNEEPTGRTYRDWTRDALEGLTLSQFLILYSLGPAIDVPITRWDEEFLPSVLAEDLDATRIGPDDKPLVKRKRKVVKRIGADVGVIVPGYETAVPVVFFVLMGLGLLLPLALGRRKLGARLAGLGIFTWGLAAGLGGLMLVLYWTITTHYDTHYNENLLVTPVLHLWLVGPGLKLVFTGRVKEKTARIIGWYLIASMGLILFDVLMKIGPFIQNNLGILGFSAAANVAVLGVLWRTGLLKSLRAR